MNGNQADNTCGSAGAVYAFVLDTDGDGVADGADNCPATFNPDQAQTGNKIGASPRIPDVPLYNKCLIFQLFCHNRSNAHFWGSTKKAELYNVIGC